MGSYREQRNTLPTVCVSRWRLDGSTRAREGRKSLLGISDTFWDKPRQTEKGLKPPRVGRDRLKTQRLSSLCSYLWCWVGFHSWFLFSPSSLKNVMNSISFLTGNEVQHCKTSRPSPSAQPLIQTGLHTGHPEPRARVLHPVSKGKCHIRLVTIAQQSSQVLQERFLSAIHTGCQ